MKKINLREQNQDKWLSFHYRIAHHPTCDSFDEDFYKLFKRKVCRGCVMMYSGLITSILILPWLTITRIGFNPFLHLVLVYVYFLPTIFTSIFKPRRKIRDIARFLLGVTYTEAVLAIYASFSQSYLVWWTGIVVILTYLLGSSNLSKIRDRSNNKKCMDCEEVNNPFCSGLKDYSDRRTIIEGARYRLDTYSE